MLGLVKLMFFGLSLRFHWYNKLVSEWYADSEI